MIAFHAAWITSIVMLVVWFLILIKVQGNPDLKLRWRRGDRVRFRLRLLVLVLPSVAMIAWIGPKVGRGLTLQPPPPTWISELHPDGGDGAGPQRRLEAQTTSRIAAALSKTIGAEHFRVMVRAPVDESGKVQRLLVDLVVDDSRIDYDAGSNRYTVKPRPPDQIAAALEVTKSVSEFDSERGDRATLTTVAFDHPRLIERQTVHRARLKQGLWTYRAINIAKVLGVIGYILIFGFVVRAIERGVGLLAKEADSAPASSQQEAT